MGVDIGAVVSVLGLGFCLFLFYENHFLGGGYWTLPVIYTTVWGYTCFGAVTLALSVFFFFCYKKQVLGGEYRALFKRGLSQEKM